MTRKLMKSQDTELMGSKEIKEMQESRSHGLDYFCKPISEMQPILRSLLFCEKKIIYVPLKSLRSMAWK